MHIQRWFHARDLAALAKTMRTKAGKTKAEAAREMGVNRATIQQAEEMPELSLTKLRLRLIEKYSSYHVHGPGYWLRPKKERKTLGRQTKRRTISSHGA